MSVRTERFRLNKSQGKIMGVCAGLADYTGVDLTLVRVGVVLLTIFALGPVAVVAYLVLGWVANDKPREFYDADPAETKFWQKVRARPGHSVRDVRSKFRDIDRRLADVETHVTSQNRRLADEIEALNDDMASLKRTLDRIPPSWARAIADENDGPREQRLLNLLGWAARRLPQPYRDYLSREVPELVVDT